MSLISEKRLIILHGQSGSGKTSLLMNGVIPRLSPSQLRTEEDGETHRDASLFARWRRRLAEVDANPFIGPRPQRVSDDREDLVGRDPLLDWICGTGGGPEIATLLVRVWPTMGDDGAELDEFIVRAIRESHSRERLGFPPQLDPDQLETAAAAGSLDQWIDDLTGGNAVLILDQFEELLRRGVQSGNPETARRLVDWAIEGAFRYQRRVVISLRTDSIHMLDDLLQGKEVRPFSMSRMPVGPIADEDEIQKIMIRAQAHADLRCEVSTDAQETLLSLWRAHGPSLLEFQATLYSLYFTARDDPDRVSGPVVIGPDLVLALADEVEMLSQEESQTAEATKFHPTTPFRLGLFRAIERKLGNAELAAVDVGCDPYLVLGTRDLLRRIGTRFSSAGFKIPVTADEFVEGSLERELEVLVTDWPESRANSTTSSFSSSVAVAAGLFKTLLESSSPLSSTHDELLEGESVASDKRRPWGAIGAGPLAGWNAVAVLVEEVRRARFALAWLTETDIVRLEPDATIQLVHDGAGTALARWVRHQPWDPEIAVYGLTASHGERFGDSARAGVSGGQGVRLSSGAGLPLIVPNLVWRDSRITVGFDNVAFVNCDFTGSRFVECEFRGVTFINCLLDDVNFEHCTVGAGSVLVADDPNREWNDRAPSFFIDLPDDQIRSIAPYLERLGGDIGVRLFSDTSGVPVELTREPSAPAGMRVIDGIERRVVNLANIEGGLAISGGRLCFLTFNRCVSEPGGSIHLSDVAGAGLDIVEQMGGSVLISHSAIRGLAVSRDEFSAHSPDLPFPEIRVEDSFLLNTTFGPFLRGKASIDRSIAWGVLNGSDRKDFDVTISRCRYAFLVNTDEPDRDFAPLEEGDQPGLAETSGFMQERFLDETDLAQKFDVFERNLKGLERRLINVLYHERPELLEKSKRTNRTDT